MTILREPHMGNQKRPTSPARESADKVIARKLPQWQVVSAEDEADDQPSGDTMKTDEGPSIATLRRKFGVADDHSSDPDFDVVDESVETVRIAPKSGGPAKTADIKNGEVKIVQG